MPLLKLSRRPGEAIQIGSDVIVKVESVRGQRVSISIEAPKTVEIWRDEIGHDEPPTGKGGTIHGS